MPEPSLQEQIKKLNPNELNLLKRQLQALPKDKRSLAYGRLQGIPELADILGTTQAQISRQVETPRQPQQALTTNQRNTWTEFGRSFKPKITSDMPLWQKELSTVLTPFNVFQEYVAKPFGAFVTAPWTPGLPGGRRSDETPLEYAMRQYEAWREPEFTMPWGGKFRPVKGLTELPAWMAIPGAGAIAGKLGKLAQTGGVVGKVAGVGEKIVRPAAELEALPGKVVGKAIKGVLPKMSGEQIARKVGATYDGVQEGIGMQFTDKVTGSTTYGNTLEEVEKNITHMRAEFEKAPYIEKMIPALKALGKTDDEIAKMSVTEARAAIESLKPKASPSVPPKTSTIVTTAFPEGIPEGYVASVNKMTELLQKAKPLPKVTQALRKPIRGARAGTYEETIQKLAKEGNLTLEAEKAARKALAGKYPEYVSRAYESLAEKMTEQDMKNLLRVISDASLTPGKEGFTRVRAFEAFVKSVVDGKPLQTNEIQLMESIFGSGFAKALMSKHGLGTRIMREIWDMMNAPRALLASGDVSGLLRQGGILSARHPIEAMKTVRPMLQAMVSDKNALMMQQIILERPRMQEALKYGLAHLELPTTISARAVMETEEAFASKLMNKFFFVRGSNRAYTTVLNDMRSRSFLNTWSSWDRAGLKYVDDMGQVWERLVRPDGTELKQLIKGQNYGTYGELQVARKAGLVYSDEDLAELARLINWASGRGDLPAMLLEHQGALASMFFAPKLFMSRLQMPTSVLPWVNKSKLARIEAWKQIGSFLGMGAGILSMAQLAGAGKVELDPRSTDFGKLRVGDTRLDIWTGYAQYMRVLAQMTTAQGKTEMGRLTPKDRGEVFARFAQSKFSPAAGLINDLIKGETFLGEEFLPTTGGGIINQIKERTYPLALQEMIDGFNNDGLVGVMLSIPGFLGVGVTIYGSPTQSAREALAQKKYKMSWDEVGKTYGRARQLELEQSDEKISLPLYAFTGTIQDARRIEERQKATGNPSLMEQYRSEGENIEKTYRDAVTLATKEFHQTGDGVQFKEKIDEAKALRRKMYEARTSRKEYQDIKYYFEQPLTPQQTASMNPLDIARREFMQTMYAPDMYDEFKNYRFDEAEKREKEFVRKYGQEALEYIESYSGEAWADKPVELKALEQAQQILEPYWRIADDVWALYSPELKVISGQIDIMERTDPIKARRWLRQYPQILRARELIARQRRIMRMRNPQIRQVYQTFYGR